MRFGTLRSVYATRRALRFPDTSHTLARGSVVLSSNYFQRVGQLRYLAHPLVLNYEHAGVESNRNSQVTVSCTRGTPDVLRGVDQREHMVAMLWVGQRPGQARLWMGVGAIAFAPISGSDLCSYRAVPLRVKYTDQNFMPHT